MAELKTTEGGNFEVFDQFGSHVYLEADEAEYIARSILAEEQDKDQG